MRGEYIEKGGVAMSAHCNPGTGGGDMHAGDKNPAPAGRGAVRR
ncbi:hypothetical protein GCM10022416_51240 [Actinomadura keratinilytica]|uniref:Uncharacterized protein n=1 Tax=Actinomadura keratinilytica TaxID=547461 RepID=A0ABP7ZBX5_9ACTN